LTPQVARIVSNRLKASDSVSRLCYAGEVLKTRNNKAKGSRSPIQIGAELFGHAGVESDIEIIELMLESMQTLNLSQIKLSLGHVGIVDELISLAGLEESRASQLIDILERKAAPEYETFIANTEINGAVCTAFKELLSYCGDAATVIAVAKTQLSPLSSSLNDAVERLETVIDYLKATHSVSIHLDLADIQGYQYHTGVIFACYAAGGQLLPVAKGGRYDNIGSDFGLALPATGFSLDLRGALDLLLPVKDLDKPTVYAPYQADKALHDKIVALKAQGVKVVKSYDLTALQDGDQWLSNASSKWTIERV